MNSRRVALNIKSSIPNKVDFGFVKSSSFLFPVWFSFHSSQNFQLRNSTIVEIFDSNLEKNIVHWKLF